MDNFYQKFQDIELEFRDLELKGIKCWHIIRFPLFLEVSDTVQKMGERHPDQIIRRSLLKKVKLGIGFGVNAIIKNPYCRLKKGKEYLILCTPKKIFYKGNYIYPIIEPALKLLEGNYNYIERPNQFMHIKDCHEKDVAYSDYIELKRAINSFFKRFYMTELEKDQIRKIMDVFEKSFNITLNQDKIYRNINESLTGFLTYYREYGKILDKLQPQYVLEVVHYENAELALTKAAHERNIQVIELQHGTMGKGHMAYNFKTIDEYTPDKLLVFGDYWKEHTNYPGEMVAVGYPYLEEQLSEFQRHKEEKNILFISQGPIAKQLISIALQLENYIQKNNLQYKLIYKLHPNESLIWKSRYPELLNSSIEVIDNNGKNLYTLFGLADYQIGVSSTALLEGMAFGLKTIILKAPTSDYYEDMIEKNYMILVEDVEELISTICNEQSVTSNINQLWKMDSLNNLKNELVVF